MRLSTVFELLLIFLLIAFAAYGRVIDGDEVSLKRYIRSSDVGRAKQGNLGVSILSLKQATENVNKYCTCNEKICNCCRDFNIPLFSLRGPGCASLQYYENNKLAVQLSFGDTVFASRIIGGTKPKAICVPMPGGFNQFCGRIYSIERESDKHFKACLGLELLASDNLEAALRVSCFRFGPEGVSIRPAEEFPAIAVDKPDEDDDDDDLFGLDDDDDDDEDDEDEEAQLPSKNTGVVSLANQQAAGEVDEDEDEDDDDDDDILGFDALVDFITGDDDSGTKKPTTAAPVPAFTIPIIKPSTAIPTSIKVTPKPAHDEIPTVPTSTAAPQVEHDITDKLDEAIDTTETLNNVDATTPADSTVTEVLHVNESTPSAEVVTEKIAAAESNDIKYMVKPEDPTVINKRITVGVPYRKVSVTSNSVNAIKNDVKPSTRPVKPDPIVHENNDVEEDDILNDDDDDDDDDDDLESIENVDDEDDEEIAEEVIKNKKKNIKKPVEVNKDHEEDEDNEEESILEDDEDDEDAVLSALVSDDDDNSVKTKKVEKIATTESTKHEETDEDYEDLSDLLSRKRSLKRGRQSKVMRL